MNRDPVVSVVIPAYNQPHDYLAECLESLRMQTVPQWEAIVVDDGSTTGDVYGVVSRLGDPRIRVIRHLHNRGMGAARNTGVKAARADLVLSLDADDRLTPTFLKAALDALDSEPEANCVFTDFQLFGESSDVLRFPAPLPPPCPHHPVFPDTAVLIRKDFWHQVGGYAEDRELGGAEWWDFWIRAIQAGLRVVHVPEPLYLYRKHASAASLTSTVYNDYQARKALYRRHRVAFDSFDGPCPRCGPRPTSVAAFRARGYVTSSEGSLARGERGRAIRLAFCAATIQPGSVAVMKQLVRSLLPSGSLPLVGGLKRQAARVLAAARRNP